MTVALLVVGCDDNDERGPAGRIVVLDDSRVLVIPAAGGRARPLAIDAFSDVAFSPDGRRVAFNSEQGIRVVTLKDGRAVLLPDTQPTGYLSGDVSWAPDGQRLAFANNETIYTISANLSGGNYPFEETRPSDIHEVTRGSEPSWAPDGEHIVFVRRGDVYTDEGDIAIVRIDGSGFRRLGRGRSPAVSPSGDAIAYSTRAGVFVMPIAGGSPRLVAKGGWEPVWSPDGKFLAFTRDTTCGHAACSGRVFVMPLKGGKARPIGPTMGDPPGPEAWIR